MDHALTLHSDGTLTITLPKDAEVSRVVVNGASYRQVTGKLDCISRQEAIDALKTDCSWDIFDEYGNVTERGKDIIEAISRVPFVEPEIIRCGDCRHWYPDADSGMACEFTNMSQPVNGYCNWAERRENG